MVLNEDQGVAATPPGHSAEPEPVPVSAASAASVPNADRTYLRLSEEDQKRAAFELDDESLAKWTRWALATCAKHYEGEAAEKQRSLMEIITQHGVIALALLTLKTNATRASFEVDGITYKGQPKGDWRVTIERISAP